MLLKRLDVRHLRVLDGLAWEPEEGVNLVVGPNGAGKTTLIEAIFLLTRGRSFRGGRWRDLVAKGAEGVSVRGRFRGDDGRGIQASLVQKGSSREIRLDGHPLKNRESLVGAFPVRLIHSHSGELITGEPALRRSFVDWNLFHVEHGYSELWRRYHRARRQKAGALRNGWRDLTPWNRELVRYGVPLIEERMRYLKDLDEALSFVFADHPVLFQLRLSYARVGYEGDFPRALDVLVGKELEKGQCVIGPHRDEVVLTLDGYPAKQMGSAGQLRLAVAGLQLAAERVFQQRVGRKSLWLLDDLSAEWDEEAQDWCLRKISAISQQCLVTKVGRRAEGAALPMAARVFHVEHGDLRGCLVIRDPVEGVGD